MNGVIYHYFKDLCWTFGKDKELFSNTEFSAHLEEAKYKPVCEP